MRRLLRVLKPVIIVTVMSLLMIELGLMLFDPWRVMNLRDFGALDRFMVPDPSGFGHPANSRLDLFHWSFTTTADGTRTVPAAVPDGPRVVFVGDSVTFGDGVNDEDTWVSLVAGRLGLNAINAARIRYSAENVQRLLDQYPDDCVVFLTIENDYEPSYNYRVLGDAERQPPPWKPYIQLYLEGIAIQREAGARGRDLDSETAAALPREYTDAMAAIAAHPTLLLLAFDTNYGAMVKATYGAALIPYYTGVIGVFDSHANAAGNVELADSITPLVKQWLDSGACKGTEGNP